MARAGGGRVGRDGGGVGGGGGGGGRGGMMAPTEALTPFAWFVAIRRTQIVLDHPGMSVGAIMKQVNLARMFNFVTSFH